MGALIPAIIIFMIICGVDRGLRRQGRSLSEDEKNRLFVLMLCPVAFGVPGVVLAFQGHTKTAVLCLAVAVVSGTAVGVSEVLRRAKERQEGPARQDEDPW